MDDRPNKNAVRDAALPRNQRAHLRRCLDDMCEALLTTQGFHAAILNALNVQGRVEQEGSAGNLTWLVHAADGQVLRVTL